MCGGQLGILGQTASAKSICSTLGHACPGLSHPTCPKGSSREPRKLLEGLLRPILAAVEPCGGPLGHHMRLWERHSHALGLPGPNLREGRGGPSEAGWLVLQTLRLPPQDLEELNHLKEQKQKRE